MTPHQYRRAREKRGTLSAVAARLGVDRSTLFRRESGRVAITEEARLAMLALPVPGFDVPAMTAGLKPRRKRATHCVDFAVEFGGDLPTEYAEYGGAK